MVEKNCSQCAPGAPCEYHEGHIAPEVREMPVLTVELPDDLMAEACRLTSGDRRAAYGDPREVFGAYGLAWSAILRHRLKPGEIISAEEVTLMMTALKLCREAQSVKRDNIVDAHGYLGIHAEIAGLK